MEKVTHKINVGKDDPSTITSHQVFFSLYQQLVGDEGEEHFRKLFQPDFFDLIIVDECHRGSAKEESRWRLILEYFKSATQIGIDPLYDDAITIEYTIHKNPPLIAWIPRNIILFCQINQCFSVIHTYSCFFITLHAIFCEATIKLNRII